MELSAEAKEQFDEAVLAQILVFWIQVESKLSLHVEQHFG
jgi:hypothetical protein